MNILEKILFIFDKKQKRDILFLLLLILGGSIVELLGVSAILPIVQLILVPEKVFNNKLLMQIYEFLGVDSTTDFLIYLLFGIIILYLFKSIYLSYLFLKQNEFTYENQRKLSTQLLSIYMFQPYSFHLNTNSSELIRNINSDAQVFYRLVFNVLLLITDCVTCLMLVLFLFISDWEMTTSLIAIVALIMLIYFWVIKKKVKCYGEKFRYYNGKIIQWLQQSLGGIKETKILKREKYFINNYSENYSMYADNIIKYNVVSNLPKYFLESICICVIILVLIVKAYRGDNLMNLVPQISIFIFASIRLIPSVNKISVALNEIMFALPSLDLVYVDIKGMEEMKSKSIVIDDKNLKNQFSFDSLIEIKNMSYKYDITSEYVLSDINLKIRKNTSIAFIGTSGAGKTTLVDIILGLLVPTKGAVLVDGKNIQTNIDEWKEKVGYIPQAIYLSDDSIRNNIAFGLPESQIDDKLLWDVIEEAQLKEFVESQPNGINTKMGENGVRMSGGQRQRIGIARALYKRAELLVLDEATSALDNSTEAAIIDAINQFKGTKTIIIIAHRLSTIEKCDYVYEVKNGGIIQKNR